jgi:hypothetical protein
MDSGVFRSRPRATGGRPFFRGKEEATTASADPAVFQGALLVVAAAAGLAWALSQGSSGGAREEPTPIGSPETPRPSM